MKIETVEVVTHEVNCIGDGFELFESDYDYPSNEYAKALVDGLNAKSGHIEFYRNDFECKVTTHDGLLIELSQSGEYDMYGGPYSPKFRNTYVGINGKHYTENFIHYMLTQNKHYYDNESEIDLSGCINMDNGIDKHFRNFIEDLRKIIKL